MLLCHMRKLLLLLFLLSLSSNVLAIDSWEYIAQSEDKGTFIYIYADKMKKENEYVFIWTLLNFKEPDKQGNLSNLIYMKFDCKWYRYKNLKYSFHKKPMGRGGIKTSAPKNIEWHYIKTYQVSSKIFDRVCD